MGKNFFLIPNPTLHSASVKPILFVLPRCTSMTPLSQSSVAQQGSKLEIPLWLAKGLHDSKRRIISVELPNIYKEAWRTVFSADANVVDLHKMGPYYYGFGSQLLNFDNPENPEIAQTAQQPSEKMSWFYANDFWADHEFLDQAVG
ncbi:hypothetical protein BTVI_98933 [Pitangus sulphuratus]|nr:hypothetical protein BTVI_98933 [Pitangus sulphuratus]